MQALKSLMPAEHMQTLTACSKPSFKNLGKSNADFFNGSEGSLTGYDCRECRNNGYIAYVNDSGIMSLKTCKCKTARDNMKRIEESGLAGQLETSTFETFKTPEEWQKALKSSALRFVGEQNGSWFFVSGQSGSGKTHICTAIAGKLLETGLSLRYMLWRDAAVKIKAYVNDNPDEYSRLLEPLKTVDVLYIDDFLKFPKTDKMKFPSAGDLNLAYELLNSRCINKKSITLISTERKLEEICDYDIATGGRIYERSKNFCNYTGSHSSRNLRMKEI